MTEGKVLCRTPNKPDGGKPNHIDTWKFEAMEAAIRACLRDQPGDSMGFMAAVRAIPAYLDAGVAARIGSKSWYATTVLLEMEWRGDLKATKVKGTKTLTLT